MTMRRRSLSALHFFWLLFAYALADLELHLAGFLIGIDHDVIAVQNFAVKNLQCQRILNQLLNRALQRTCAEVGVVTLSEEQFFSGVGKLDRDFAIGQQTTYVFEP